MTTLGLILFFTFFGSVLSLAGIVLFLLWNEERFKKSSIYFASFAAGILLAVSFFDLLPEAVESAVAAGRDLHSSVFLYAILGFLGFFLIERAFHWHHYHEGRQHGGNVPSHRYLVMIGDFLHNFLDGIAMAATFLVSPALGITTAVAVFFHEIPKEIGDVSLLIHSGMSRKGAILFNLLSTVAAFAGAIFAFLSAGKIADSLDPFLAFAAGGLLYIAASDLIPEIQEETKRRRIVAQVSLLFIGVVIMWTIGQILPRGE